MNKTMIRLVVLLSLALHACNGEKSEGLNSTTQEVETPSESQPISNDEIGLDLVPLSVEMVAAVPVEEHCKDAIHCEGSAPEAIIAVAFPLRAEEVKAPSPPADEIQCNGEDEDGDGTDDCSGDSDADGVPADFDCDDHNAARYPGAVEIACDGVDQNCDGDDACDSDGDGLIDQVDCAPSDPKITSECRNHTPAAPSL